MPPKENDKASTGRILYFTYKEYASRWEEITAVFSKDAVLHGSFDKFAESEERIRGRESLFGSAASNPKRKPGLQREI